MSDVPYIEDSDDEDAPYMLHLDIIAGDYYVTADEALAFADWFDDICGGSTDVGEAIREFVGTVRS